MQISIENKASSVKGLNVVALFKGDLKKLPQALNKDLQELLKKEFSASSGETLTFVIKNGSKIEKYLAFGLGEKKNFAAKHARLVGAKLLKALKAAKADSASLQISSSLHKYFYEFAEGLLLATYQNNHYKTKKEEGSVELKSIAIVTTEDKKELETDLKRAKEMSEAIAFVKDLVNGPSNFVHSEYLAAQAKGIAKENKYGLTIFTHKELKKMGWGGLLGVNQGSKNDPKCLVLEYKGASNKKEKPIFIVGKGVIFDTGGYNIKPTGSIETMQQDMAGAAVVLGIFKLLKKFGIKKNVIGLTPIAENLVSETAFRPADVITMYSGKTVEITNTDAEGRLILADAITYAVKQNPEAIITIATLTGAVAVALGDRYAGLVSNAPKLRTNLAKAGREVDELAWPLPLHPDFKKKFNSDIADLRNCDVGSSRYAGCSKGAAFLSQFIDGNKWCHIDIGGTAHTSEPREFEQKGATAHGLRLLLNYLEKF